MSEGLSRAKDRVSIVQGDITQQKVDAIVNAANKTLLGGGGVDGAIHRAAGPELYQECTTLGGCETGHAKVTKGFLLPARYVIHTVGPMWENTFVAWIMRRLGMRNDDDLLASCYRTCLALAKELGIQTIAFPLISTGVYGFPLQRSAQIALTEIHHFLCENDAFERVVVVCFTKESYDIYTATFKKMLE